MDAGVEWLPLRYPFVPMAAAEIQQFLSGTRQREGEVHGVHGEDVRGIVGHRRLHPNNPAGFKGDLKVQRQVGLRIGGVHRHKSGSADMAPGQHLTINGDPVHGEAAAPPPAGSRPLQARSPWPGVTLLGQDGHPAWWVDVVYAVECCAGHGKDGQVFALEVSE